MAGPSHLARKAVCLDCNRWLLRTFIAGMGSPAVVPRASPPRMMQRRTFTTSLRTTSDVRPNLAEDRERDDIISDAFPDASPPVSSTPIQDTLTGDNDPPQPQPNAHVPWYLQETSASPEMTRSPEMAERQRLPDLPEHAPPILQTLLERVSVDLGMDDLALLDLRTLDPPPALGANLLMIVGTARSEKHLHVSADRLCRWLRTEYALSPFADGLLGRNELKLKLRRRAKRTKLFSSIGAKQTADTEIDDGIRTGWVCVNVGRVEGGELPRSAEEVESERHVVGFGTSVSGAQIVVQLMTEEKREEIGLERLWNGVLKKSKREAAEAAEAAAAPSANAKDVNSEGALSVAAN